MPRTTNAGSYGLVIAYLVFKETAKPSPRVPVPFYIFTRNMNDPISVPFYIFTRDMNGPISLHLH